MAVQIIMDHNGDTRHVFDANNARELARAEKRFRELTGAGFTAAMRTGSGDAKVIRKFDASSEETLFVPRLVGG